MTAKEALRELVDEMSEEDAQDALDILRDMFHEPVETPPLSQREFAAASEAIRRMDAGEGIPHSDAKRRLGL